MVTAGAVCVAIAGCGVTTSASSGATSPATSERQATPAAAASANPVHAWLDGGGRQLLTDLSGDSQRIATAAGNQDVTGVGAGCAVMQRDVEKAQAYDHIPLASAQTHWSAALAQYARSATDCITATSTGDGELMTRAGNEMSVGNTETDAVAQAFKNGA